MQSAVNKITFSIPGFFLHAFFTYFSSCLLLQAGICPPHHDLELSVSVFLDNSSIMFVSFFVVILTFSVRLFSSSSAVFSAMLSEIVLVPEPNLTFFQSVNRKCSIFFDNYCVWFFIQVMVLWGLCLF